MNHWTKEACKSDALKYQRRGEWSKQSSSAYRAASRNSWLDECCGHMPKPVTQRKRKPLKWHKDACLEDAKRFDSRSDWYKLSGSAYNSAKNNDWLEECCKHMPLKKGGRTDRKPISQYWDFDSCFAEAGKYNSVSEWQGNSGSSYQAALRNKWVDQCTYNMERNKTKLELIRHAVYGELEILKLKNDDKEFDPFVIKIAQILNIKT